MTYLVERVAQYLVKHGNSSTTEIAKALGETKRRVSDSVKAERNRAHWGIFRVGYATKGDGSGHPPSIWGINKHTYLQYLEQRRDMPWIAKRVLVDKIKPGPKPKAKQAKQTTSVKVPKEVYRVSANRPVYDGPMLTNWLPCSPYYANQRKENK